MAKPRMVICKHCGAEISSSAVTCPECGRKTVSKVKSNLASIFMVIGIVIFAVTLIESRGGEGNNGKPGAKDDVITMAEFEAVETGMTYAEVVQVIGVEGELASGSDTDMDDAHKTAIYSWTGNGDAGSNANVTFQGDKVIAKDQSGLK